MIIIVLYIIWSMIVSPIIVSLLHYIIIVLLLCTIINCYMYILSYIDDHYMIIIVVIWSWSHHWFSKRPWRQSLVSRSSATKWSAARRNSSERGSNDPGAKAMGSKIGLKPTNSHSFGYNTCYNIWYMTYDIWYNDIWYHIYIYV